MQTKPALAVPRRSVAGWSVLGVGLACLKTRTTTNRGAINVLFNGSIIIIGEVDFSDNYSEGEGGAVALASGDELTAVGDVSSNFIGNTASCW